MDTPPTSITVSLTEDNHTRKRRRFRNRFKEWDNLPTSDPKPLPWDTETRLKRKFIQAFETENIEAIRTFIELGMELQLFIKEYDENIYQDRRRRRYNNDDEEPKKERNSEECKVTNILFKIISTNQNLLLIKYLIEDLLYDVNMIRRVDGINVLMLLFQSQLPKDINNDLIMYLLNNHINLSVIDKNGHSVLFYAIHHNHYDCIPLLVKFGVEVNTIDVVGWNVLKYAIDKPIQSLSLPTIHYLLKQGINVDIHNDLVHLSIFELIIHKHNQYLKAKAASIVVATCCSSSSTSESISDKEISDTDPFTKLLQLSLQFSVKRNHKIFSRCFNLSNDSFIKSIFSTYLHEVQSSSK